MNSPARSRFEEMIDGPNHRWWVLGAVECGNFVVYMDAFIVTLALPAMARYFEVGIHQIKWVLVAYLASLTVSLLTAGRLADRWGRKPLTIFGIALLAISSGLCALAPSLPSLIAFRILKGLGGAFVLANVMASITANFPKEERRRAMAFNASILALGQVTGLLLGGAMIDWLGWRSIFMVIFAVGIVGLVLDVLVLRDVRDRRSAPPLDLWGVLLSILVVGTPFLLVERLVREFQNPLSLFFVLAGFFLLGLFVMVERRAAAPLLDLHLFKLRAFTCGSISAAFYFIAATFAYFLMPLYAQIVLGLTPFYAGLLIVPLAVALTVTSQLVGRLAGKFSARVISTTGLLCTSSAVFGMSFLHPDGSYLFAVACLALVGIGGGLFHPPNNSSVLSSVPAQSLGRANGFFTTSRNFGQAIGAALAATILVYGLGHKGAAQILEVDSLVQGQALADYLHAQSFAFRLGAALGLAGAVISTLRGIEMATEVTKGRGIGGKRRASPTGIGEGGRCRSA